MVLLSIVCIICLLKVIKSKTECSSCKVERQQFSDTFLYESTDKKSVDRKIFSDIKQNVLIAVEGGVYFKGTDAHVGYPQDREGECL